MNRLLKEPANGLMHFFWALAALAGAIVLVVLSRGDLPKQLSLAAYGVGAVGLFLASAAYHLIRTTPEKTLWLRKLDHSAIFLLIAGTYTPVAFNVLTGGWRWGMLIGIWAIAILGIVLKTIFMPIPRGLSAGLYVAMGWLAVVAFGPMMQSLPAGALAWIIAGGLIYTAGALVYAFKWLNFAPGVFGFHEVWHVFVMAASLCHFLGILLYVVPYPRLP